MTQHITTNGNQILGTTGNAQVTSVIADSVLCSDVRHRMDLGHLEMRDGKRLSKPGSERKRLERCSECGFEAYPAREFAIPAAAWASLVMSRPMSNASTSL